MLQLKLKTYFVAMMLSVAFLLIMPFVHHHHHAGEICLEQDQIVERICDGHQEHDGKHSQSPANKCVERSDFVVKRAADNSPALAQVNVISFLPAYLLSLADILSTESFEQPYVIRDEAPAKSCFVHAHILRAPPIV
jgi:hypothetical protein